MIDLTQVIHAVITLIVACISVFLIPYLKGKFSADQLANIMMWVNIAVEAAEMIYKGHGKGAEKKEYVVAFLESKGFTVKGEELDTLIEAAVMELNLELKS